MPIARSNTSGGKSRPVLSSTTSPRPFLPPSHYAAAAGMSYTKTVKSPTRSENSGFLERNPSTSSKDTAADPQQYHNAFMPVSYPSESESTSGSSYEFKPSVVPRYSTVSGESSVSKSPGRTKRQSLITGLPELETSLLPSLRDTIDRMTRTPTHATSSSSPATTTQSDYSNLQNSSWSTHSTSPISHQLYRNAYMDESLTTSRSPKQTSSRIQSRATTPVEPSTPRLVPPVKSALRSALRAPTSKKFSGTSPVAEPAANSPSVGTTLRSMRNILSRKPSSAGLSDPPTVCETQSRKTNKNPKEVSVTPSFQRLRGRSRTDPGSSNSEAFSPQSHATSPLLGTVPGNSSNIPRPCGFDRSPHLGLADINDSDFEYHGPHSQEHRRLVVANAEVFPSSSESEAEGTARTRNEVESQARSTDPLRFNLNSHNGDGIVGLGFDYQQASQIRKSTEQESPSRYSKQARTKGGDQGKWAAGGEVYTRQPWSSRLRKHSGTNNSEDGPLSDLDADHRRRKAALIGIVSGLELASSPVGIGESEDSEYCGEEGFAISGSGDLTRDFNPPVPTSQNLAYKKPNHENDTSIQRPLHSGRRAGRPRSSSCMPSIVLSSENNETRPSSRRTRLAKHQLSPAPRNASNPAKARKSPSRSPVVRQDDPVPIPAALRRHSVYHRSLSPNERAKCAPTPKRPKISLERCDSNMSDALSITERSYAAAARERRAFGIPPSESVEVYQRSSHHSGESLSHAESDLSSVGSVYWNEAEGAAELSPGAETLFRKLSGGAAKETARRSHQVGEASRRFSTVSKRSSISSIYDDPDTEDNKADPHSSIKQHDDSHVVPSTLGTDLRQRTNDNVEMKRQKLIHEIAHTENMFVHRLQTFVTLFVLPLRVQHTRTWIHGVPSEVARLFDWLDDIMNLHNQLLASLESTLTTQRPVVKHIAESLRTFTSRLEIYQPYLVRLADVMALIYQLLEDEKSDFGEFIDIQEGAPECEGWKFDTFLVEPVNRLAQYPDFLSRLIALTPKSHPDYLSTFFLLHSTDMAIRVLTEVKDREDEYDMIKNIAARVWGLPSSAQLATRERRLLFHGTLNLTEVNGEKCSALANTILPREHALTGQTSSLPRDRSSRLANAIHQWDARRSKRSGSTSSSSTGASLFSFVSASSGPSDSPATPCSTFFPSFRLPSPAGRINKTRSTEQKRLVESPSPSPRHVIHYETLVQVFIFTDVVLLAMANSGPTSEVNDWTMLRKIGVVRVLGISELSKQDSPNSNNVNPLKPVYNTTSSVLDQGVTLEALPVDLTKLNQGLSDHDSSITTLRLVIPMQGAPGMTQLNNNPLASWISAFQQCCNSTLRSISLQSQSKPFDPHSDHEHDVQQTVFSLLASGLPFPKSPSVQLAEFQDGQTADVKTQEREERGWWSLRFQQVFRDLHRQDLSNAVVH